MLGARSPTATLTSPRCGRIVTDTRSGARPAHSHGAKGSENVTSAAAWYPSPGEHAELRRGVGHEGQKPIASEQEQRRHHAHVRARSGVGAVDVDADSERHAGPRVEAVRAHVGSVEGTRA